MGSVTASYIALSVLFDLALLDLVVIFIGFVLLSTSGRIADSRAGAVIYRSVVVSIPAFLLSVTIIAVMVLIH